jgi:site-specific recombinase XerD
MISLSRHLFAYLHEHLPQERQASRHTCDAYAYTFQLLICFASEKLKIQPSSLFLEQLDAPLILAFLNHIENDRKNCARTRNARLAAIKSFFKFVEYRVPSAIDQARRIHAIPAKKIDESLIDFLNREELQAILDSPDPHTRAGLRDRAMLHLAFATGLRVSELVELRIDQLELYPHPLIHVYGKGRRERILPLWKETTMAIRAWLQVRGDSIHPEVFLNARGTAMTRFGFEYVLSKHVKLAAVKQPSLSKKRVSPHVLRHTCAMHTLQATCDIRKVALWLGHASVQSTEIYLRADPNEKLDALSKVTPPTLRRGRFCPSDRLLEMIRPKK